MIDRTTASSALLAPVEAQPQNLRDTRNAEIDLRPYVNALWRRRFVIAVVTVIAGVIAFTVAIRSVRVYEASVILGVSASKLNDNAAAIAVTTANFRPIVGSRVVAQQVVTAFHLDGPPYQFSASSFLENAVQIEEIRNSGLLRLAVRLREPQLTANVANALAKSAVDYSQSLNQNEAIRARDFLKTQLDTARDRLQHAESALTRFKETAQVELAQADVAAIIDQRKSLLQLLVDIEATKARVLQAQQALNDHQSIVVLNRTLLDDPAFLEAARAAAKPSDNLVGLQMRSESLNGVYQSIDRNLTEDRSELAALEKRRQQLVNVRGLSGSQIAKVRELYDKQGTQVRLETEFNLAQRNYVDVASKYDGARLQVAARSTELDVIDPAVPPEHPLSRQVLSRTAVGIAVGFGIGVVGALLLALRSGERFGA
jgi:uncharacterized protein involved in exopolysaccharide biosynthesis